MSKYIIEPKFSSIDIPAWTIPKVKKIAEEQGNTFGLNFDRIEYHDYGELSRYFTFQAVKELKEHSFIIDGVAHIDEEEKLVERFYLTIKLQVGSERINYLYFANESSDFDRFMKYAETPEFDEYINEMKMNTQVIEQMSKRNREISGTIRSEINQYELE